jgi:hypothetical protein
VSSIGVRSSRLDGDLNLGQAGTIGVRSLVKVTALRLKLLFHVVVILTGGWRAKEE